jgi:hypothetical protein
MRSIRMAALAVAMTLMFSGFALARDHDQDSKKNDHWDKHADRDRHRDGDRNQHHDRWEDRDRERNRERNDRWWQRDRRRADGDYREGQIYNRYPQSYPGRNGYPGGGVYGYPGGGYPSGGYGYPGSVYGRSGHGRNAGYDFGYRDGSYMASRDISQDKRFNPNPRNEYGNRTHGYNSSFGDKNYYRAEYSSGYTTGYEANYRGGRNWGY